MIPYVEIEGERWRQLPDRDGRYWVSDHGRMRARCFDGFRVLALGINSGGYKLAMLGQGTAPQKAVLLHRLVATYFIPGVVGKNVVNHIDGDKTNNHFANLEWVTHCENLAKAVTLRGGKHWSAGGKNAYRVAVWATDPTSGKRTRLASLRDAAEWVSGLTVAAGGLPMNVASLAPNICNAAKRGGMAYGFLWKRAKRSRRAPTKPIVV